MNGRVLKRRPIEHPLPDPPPSMGREIGGNPEAQLRGFLYLRRILHADKRNDLGKTGKYCYPRQPYAF
jgi:hypothetical protein